MLGILLDAAVLMFLLKVINEDEIGFGTSVIVAVIASVGTTLLAIGLRLLIGIAGVAVAAVIAALLLGVAVAALFGVEIKRSFLIAGLFMLVHMGVALGLHYTLRS